MASPTSTPAPIYGDESRDGGMSRVWFDAVQAAAYTKLTDAFSRVGVVVGNSQDPRSPQVKKFQSSPYTFSISNITPDKIELVKRIQGSGIASISQTTVQATLAGSGGSILGGGASTDPIGRFINSQQLGLRNTGGAVAKDYAGNTYLARAGVDIDILGAWRVDSGLGIGLGRPDSIVVVIDDGFDLKGADFTRNLMTNTKEVPCNGIDDDKNGYIDDYQGWDAVRLHGCYERGALTETLAVESKKGHGTHVASIIAAAIPRPTGNGGVGVAPEVKLWPIKAYSDELGGYDSASLTDAYSHILALKRQGFNIVVVNTSYTAPCQFIGEAERIALEALVAAGITIVGAAGNDGISSEQTPMCPGSLGYKPSAPEGVRGILSVANAPPGGLAMSHAPRVLTPVKLHPWSNFGRGVTTAAPGTVVLANGELRSGTSMAAPHLSGIVALMYSVNPLITPAEVETIIGSPSSARPLNFNVRSLGMVSAAKAVTEASKQVVAGIVRASGNPVSQAYVVLKVGNVQLRSRTDSKGRFYIVRPPIGSSFTVSAQKSGFYFGSVIGSNSDRNNPPRLFIDGESLTGPGSGRESDTAPGMGR